MDAEKIALPREEQEQSFLVLLWLAVSSKGMVSWLNSQAVFTTFSGRLRSSPVPFLFLISHIYKNEGESSTLVPSWKESVQTKVGFE